MKSFFQRRPDTQPPPRSYTPANNDPYKVWLPPPDASRAPAAGQGGAIRNGGDTHRSSSRAGRDAPTSSAYKYATLPNNTTGFYYNPPPPPQPFPAQYYPPRPPSGGFDRPDSRAGYVPYPYPNPQYPQAFGGPLPPQPAVSKEKPRSTGDARAASVPPPALARPSSSKKHSQRDVPRKQPSSSSIKDQKPEGEVKRSKHRTREPSETRKHTRGEDPYEEKRRERSSRKEPRRESRSRSNIRLVVEEEDSSDSSVRRPSSAAGHRREGRPPLTMNKSQQDPTPFPRAGFPGQATPPSSSSGKQTPQIPRMPVYLPASHGRAQSQRHDDQPGQSESDTDHGTLNRGRNFLRGAAQPNTKQASKPAKPVNIAGPPSTLNLMNKKIKESKGLWPFSRSKSQKPPENNAVVSPEPTKYTTKSRADSTPSRFSETVDTQPEYRRRASDNAIGLQAAVLPREPPPEIQPTTSRALFFASQPSDSSRPVAAASQETAPHSFQPRSSANEAPNPVPGPERPPMAPTMPSSSRQTTVPQTSTAHGQAPGSAAGLNPISHPEIPLRREARDIANLPPIYSQPAVSRTADYSRLPDRSTTPKVSQLVAGFEARSSDLAQAAPSGVRREVREKPSLSRIYAPQPSAGTAAQPPPAVNPYVTASQPQPAPRLAPDRSSRPVVESSNTHARPVVNPPDVLKTQLRDLLTDKPAPLRAEERSQSRKTEPRNHPSAPSTLYPNSRPADWTSQTFFQPPVQVYSATTSAVPPKASSKSEKPIEATPLASTSSRRPDIPQSDSAERTSRTGVTSRGGDEVGRSSRPKREKDVIGVMKTPSKDSSRNTSSPAPNPHSHSTNQSRSNETSSRSNDKSSQPPIGVSQPSTSRLQHPAYAEAGKQAHSSTFAAPPPPTFPPTAKSTSYRDHRPTATKHDLHDPPTTSSNVHTSSLPRGERPRPAPSTSTAPVPSSQPLPMPGQSNIPSSSRTAGASSGAADAHSSSYVPSSSRRSGDRPRRVPSEESLLKTPSSLAHSVLPPSTLQPTVSRTSIPASVSSETRKKGLFGMFRSKGTNQPDPHSSDSPHDVPDRESEANPTRYHRKANVPPPITVPNPALPISDRKSPNSRVFTPFRYLTSKRTRRMSSASMDAVDGTAPNTVMGSPTASMQSSQIPPQSPPQRDPQVATQDWRNQEESDVVARGQKRGKQRRMRPGVVFDVAEDPMEETKRSRPGRLRKSQNLPPAPGDTEPPKDPPTDSGDG